MFKFSKNPLKNTAAYLFLVFLLACLIAQFFDVSLALVLQFSLISSGVLGLSLAIWRRCRASNEDDIKIANKLIFISVFLILLISFLLIGHYFICLDTPTNLVC